MNSIKNMDAIFDPHMPEVDIRADIEDIFTRARKTADEPVLGEDGLYRRQIVIVSPGRLLIRKECPLAAQLKAEQMAVLERLLPRKPARQICVIAYTMLEAMKKDLRRAIPFVDYLLGFSSLGHSVWIFEGHAQALAAGCREADLLLVDSAMLPALEENPTWRKIALSAMRGSEIKLIARGGNPE